MKQLVLFLIKVYKKTEPLRTTFAANFHLPINSCRFTPTCSEYMQQAVEKYGAWKGVILGMKRILRCNPASKGGYDPVC